MQNDGEDATSNSTAPTSDNKYPDIEATNEFPFINIPQPNIPQGENSGNASLIPDGTASVETSNATLHNQESERLTVYSFIVSIAALLEYLDRKCNFRLHNVVNNILITGSILIVVLSRDMHLMIETISKKVIIWFFPSTKFLVCIYFFTCQAALALSAERTKNIVLL